MLKILCTCLFAFLATPAWAIYKCNTVDKVTYSDSPCSDKSGAPLRVPEPGAAEITQAQRLHQQEKAALARLEKARSLDDAREEKRRTKIAKAAASERKKCAALALRSKWAEEDAAAATPKKQAAAQRKARRSAEQYALSCGK